MMVGELDAKEIVYRSLTFRQDWTGGSRARVRRYSTQSTIPPRWRMRGRRGLRAGHRDSERSHIGSRPRDGYQVGALPGGANPRRCCLARGLSLVLRGQ